MPLNRMSHYHKKAVKLNKFDLSPIGNVKTSIGIFEGFSFTEGNSLYNIFLYDGDVLEEKDNDKNSIRELGLYELK